MSKEPKRKFRIVSMTAPQGDADIVCAEGSFTRGQVWNKDDTVGITIKIDARVTMEQLEKLKSIFPDWGYSKPPR